MEDNAFQPGNLRIMAGTTVTWRNFDPVAHTATERGEEWDTGMLGEGESASITFAEAGSYDYYCIPHPDMRARVEVVPSLD